MSAYAVGVDAGGSTTEVAAGRLPDGDVVLHAAGPANATRDGARAADVIADAIAAALPSGATPATCYIGAAGAGAESIREHITRTLRERFGSTNLQLRVGDDLEIALRTVIPSGPGVAIVAGTGSAAYGENGTCLARAGGAGYLLGDEGSGFAIGFAAVRLTARAYDGRERVDETVRLVERVLEVDDRDSLLRRIYGQPHLDVPRIASLAPVLIAFAGKGNRAARTIVEQAAGELCALALAAMERCRFGPGEVAVGLCGGLLREPSFLRERVVERLTAAEPRIGIAYESEERDAHARTALRLARGLQAGRA